MAASQPVAPGLVDLEKELVCSICTELLYQPLTLLDCLHTFCGSCLKEWFFWQAARPRTSRTSPRYTCPSCRASVRETRPNATVTTLLDMVLQANPGRSRLIEEKEEIARKYKPGDAVLPTESSTENSGESDEEDRRLLENARERSLRDMSSGSGSRQSSSRTGQSFGDRRRARSADSRERTEDERARHRHEEERRTRRQAHQQTARNAAHAGDILGQNSSTRQIEHQSSLRSLLSSSDVETTTHDEIVRQIMEEGLLDDIDLDNLNQAQEEELSDRLVQIYLSRHPDRANLQQRSSEQTERPHREHRRSRSQTVQTQTNTTASGETSRHPPVSRPYLLAATPSNNFTRGHQRRASDQDNRRRRTSPTSVSQASSSEVILRPATRSASDMTSQRPRPSPTDRSRTRESSSASMSRRATEPEARTAEARIGGSRDRTTPQSTATRQILASPPSGSPTVASPTERLVSLSDNQPSGSPTTSNHRGASRSLSSRSNMARAPSVHYPEPSIACDRCERSNIQYDLHKHCTRCQDGGYHLCLRCYRLGRGCLHWFGFGSSAQANFEQQLPPSSRSAINLEQPHSLTSQRYRQPAESAVCDTNDGKQMTSDNPANRLEEGMFCDICQSHANDCFWQCSQCNEGEWGFCQRCVNQDRCCNHALLPIRSVAADHDRATVFADATPLPLTPLPASLVPPDTISYQVLSFSTKCDICTYPVPPSSTRFHCPECNEGDYDVCTNCYLKLVASGKISKENGHNGWRRCFNDHRMIVVGFEDHEDGQRRVVVRDLVGGHTFKDGHVRNHGSSNSTSSVTPGLTGVASPDFGLGNWSWKEGQTRRKKASRSRTAWPNVNTGDTSTEIGSPTTSSPITAQGVMSGSRRLFPPDGGVGLVLSAVWSYYPEDDVSDELAFPRGAEITEAENINDEWFWGYYAGSTGLFPGTYGLVIREVS